MDQDIGRQRPNIDTWQRGLRAEGLAQLYRIAPNLMAVNAQDVFPVNQQARDYLLHEIPSVARIMSHPGVAAIVVMRANGDVVLEHYGAGHDRYSIFSDLIRPGFRGDSRPLNEDESYEYECGIEVDDAAVFA
jgi:hypothetical protein